MYLDKALREHEDPLILVLFSLKCLVLFVWGFFCYQEKLRFPEWVCFLWLLLQFADNRDHTETCNTAVQQRGGRGAAGRVQAQNTKHNGMGKFFTGYGKAPAIHTHAK